MGSEGGEALTREQWNLVYNLIKARRERLTALDYEPTYSKFSHTSFSMPANEKTEEDDKDIECDNDESDYDEDEDVEGKNDDEEE